MLCLWLEQSQATIRGLSTLTAHGIWHRVILHGHEGGTSSPGGRGHFLPPGLRAEKAGPGSSWQSRPTALAQGPGMPALWGWLTGRGA